MTLKQRFFIVLISSALVGVLTIIAEENFPKAYYYFLLTILCGMVLYILMYYLVQKTSLKSYWTQKTDKTIAFFAVLASLVFGINMANKVDEEQASYWVSNGNIWLVDVFAAIILIMFLYVIFSWVFRQWKSIKKLKNEKAIAELALLKNQINPHFFFNTLNNLYSLIKNDPDTAQSYVLKLSDMMRFTIYKGKEEMVTIEDEVTYLSNFIELQTARYHKKIEIDFQQNIKNKKTLIPPLLFIILLENAFKHGVETLVDNAFIHIALEENEHRIVFSIKNNFDLDELSNTGGIGLKNLKDRLHLVYPNAHNLAFKNEDNTYFAKLELKK